MRGEAWRAIMYNLMSTMLQHLQPDVSTHTRSSAQELGESRLLRKRATAESILACCFCCSLVTLLVPWRPPKKNAARKAPQLFFLSEWHFNVSKKRASWTYITVDTSGDIAVACTPDSSKWLCTLARHTKHYKKFNAYLQSLNRGLFPKQQKELLKLFLKLTL